MDHDDIPIGRVLTRREAILLLPAAGVAMMSVGSVRAVERSRAPLRMPDCIVRPELTEGPYFSTEHVKRSDIRSEPSTGAVPEGRRLDLELHVAQVADGQCQPLPGAIVDLWQCDATGEYSAFEDRRAGFDHRGRQFLRGYQETDDDGVARFTTIYPGWYSGRAVHIHFKIRADAGSGRAYEFTSQFFFNEDTNDRVHATAPYAANGKRDTPNARDGIYGNGGDQLILPVKGMDDEALTVAFGVGLDLSDTEAGGVDGRRG